MRHRIIGGISCASLLLVLALLGAASLPLAAQSQPSPDGGAAGDDAATLDLDLPVFEPLVADLRQPRVGVTLLTTDLFRLDGPPLERPSFGFDDPDAVRRELQARVALGTSVLLAAGRPGSGLRASVGIEGGVFGRFRLESHTYDLVGTDWTVALPVAAAWGPLSARLRLLHWSAHLGDEVEKRSGARRITYGYDAADLLLSYRTASGLHLYGGGSVDLRSATRARGDRVGRGGAIQAGAEIVRRPFDDPRLALIGGVDWKRSHARGWRDQVSLVGGVERQRGDTRLRFLARAYRGPSPLGQFFLTDERMLALELSLFP